MSEKEAIMNALKVRGMTQKMLALKCGYKRQSNFTSLMSGKSMTVDNFLKMLDVLGFDLIVRDQNGSSRENTWKIERDASGGGGE